MDLTRCIKVQLIDEETKEVYKTFNLHKVLLANASKLFKQMFEDFPDYLPLTINKKEVEVTEKCLRHIYGERRIEHAFATKSMIDVAIKFQLHDCAKDVIKALCMHQITQGIHKFDMLYTIAFGKPFWEDDLTDERKRVMKLTLCHYLSRKRENMYCWAATNMKVRDLKYFVKIHESCKDMAAMMLVKWLAKHHGQCDENIVEIVKELAVHKMTCFVRKWYIDMIAEHSNADCIKEVMHQLNTKDRYEYDDLVLTGKWSFTQELCIAVQQPDDDHEVTEILEEVTPHCMTLFWELETDGSIAFKGLSHLEDEEAMNMGFKPVMNLSTTIWLMKNGKRSESWSWTGQLDLGFGGVQRVNFVDGEQYHDPNVPNYEFEYEVTIFQTDLKNEINQI